MTNDLEQTILDYTWKDHRHCHECPMHQRTGQSMFAYGEHFCSAESGPDCPWFAEELKDWLDCTFDPDELTFFSRYNTADPEALIIPLYMSEFRTSPAVAEHQLRTFRNYIQLKEQS